jgi:hypothetical protein
MRLIVFARKWYISTPSSASAPIAACSRAISPSTRRAVPITSCGMPSSGWPSDSRRPTRPLSFTTPPRACTGFAAQRRESPREPAGLRPAHRTIPDRGVDPCRPSSPTGPAPAPRAARPRRPPAPAALTSPQLHPSLHAAPGTRRCPPALQPHPSARVLGVHPDVAAQQPEVMAQGAAKATGTTYQGVVRAVGAHKAFVRVHLDEKAASAATDVLLYPTRSPRLTRPKGQNHCKQGA